MTAPKKPRERTLWRQVERAKDKLSSARQRLAAIEAGGSADHPRDVGTASVIEPRALSERCLACDGELRLVEHAAMHVDDRPLRVVRLACKGCGKERTIYFRVGTVLVS